MAVVEGAFDSGPIHLHQRHAGFDQSPRQQHALAEAIEAVAFARLCRFFRQIKRLASFRRTDQIERLPLPRVKAFQRTAPLGREPRAGRVASAVDVGRRTVRVPRCRSAAPDSATSNSGADGSPSSTHGSHSRPRKPPSCPGHVLPPSFAAVSGSVIAAEESQPIERPQVCERCRPGSADRWESPAGRFRVAAGCAAPPCTCSSRWSSGRCRRSAPPAESPADRPRLAVLRHQLADPSTGQRVGRNRIKSPRFRAGESGLGSHVSC